MNALTPESWYASLNLKLIHYKSYLNTKKFTKKDLYYIIVRRINNLHSYPSHNILLYKKYAFFARYII